MTKAEVRPIAKELRVIAKRNGGILKAEDVVEAARPKSSPLHSRFNWNDSEAAHQFRLEQARKLIQVTVSYIKVGDQNRAFRVWCSVPSDRREEGGGYREVSAVLRNSAMREELIAAALNEMRHFEEKYRSLKELTGVMTEIRRVLAEQEKDEPAVA